MPPTKLGDVVLIEWLDHSSLDGNQWQTMENAETLAPVIVRSIGWLLREDKETLVLVPHTSDENGMVFGEVCILKRVVIKRKKLRA
jgi:hypothetical protein